MNPWPFVIAAYGLTLSATIGLAIGCWLAMNKAEDGAKRP